MLKVVLDSQCLLTAILFEGCSREILRYVVSGRLQLYTSEYVLQEVREVLAGKKFALIAEAVRAIHDEIARIAEVVYPVMTFTVMRSDPDDNRVLECAFECDADAVIARDVHLLEKTQFGFTPIHSADYFLKKILLQNHRPGAIPSDTGIGRCAT
jgi:putative PIN family toxin of toxin-antitoxin system